MVRGKVVVVTGASSGIGREAAAAFAGQGATVAVVGRNAERTSAVAEAIGGQAFLADFDRLDEVRALAAVLLAAFDRIDVLANNAGGLVSTRSLTVDGHERTFQSNHLAPFLLTNLLLPRLVESSARVVSTSSLAHRFGTVDLDDLELKRRAWLGGWRAYGSSKLQTILFIEELARRTAGSGLTAYSFHPGFVATGFGSGSRIVSALMKRGLYGVSAAAGAVPLIQLATADDPGAPSGSYFDGLSAHPRQHRSAGDATLAARLWCASETLVGLASAPPPMVTEDRPHRRKGRSE